MIYALLIELGQMIMSIIVDVAPIVAVLLGFQLGILRKKIPKLRRVLIGLVYVVLGLAFFLWALMALAVRRRRGDAMSRALFWGYVGFLVGNLFDSQLLGPSAGMDFFFLAGLFFPHVDEVSPVDSS